MLYIQNNSTNPFFNIATEEYILKNFTEDCFMLWINSPSVIVGKHQNTLAEINYQYVKTNKIPVVRRLSGGGTVFHDLGNLNFTFIQNTEKDKGGVNFKKYTQPIIEVLLKLGVNAKLEGKNDIRVNNLKISGNAEHVYKNRVLHHGTLLFSSELNHLINALKVNSLSYTDKGVKSIRSKVSNISDFLKETMSVDEFKVTIHHHIRNTYHTQLYSFSKEDIFHINKLVKDKYDTWNWNFAYSPDYNLEKVESCEKGNFKIKLDVKKGIIHHVKIMSPFSNKNSISSFENDLKGQEHKEESIKKILAEHAQHMSIPANKIMNAIF